MAEDVLIIQQIIKAVEVLYTRRKPHVVVYARDHVEARVTLESKLIVLCSLLLCLLLYFFGYV